MPSLIGPFPIKICQKSDQEIQTLLKTYHFLYNHDNNQNLYRLFRFQSDSDLICIVRMVNHDRICPDSVPILPTEIRQWTEGDGRHPLENRFTWSWSDVNGAIKDSSKNPEYVTETQHITILITIVIRLDQIG